MADTLHFKRAAERANSTQPTLSEQLKALGDGLGVLLVERSRTRVLLTPIGHQIAEIARRMLRDVQEIRMLTASGGRELSGLVSPRSAADDRSLPAARRAADHAGDGRLELVMTPLPVVHGELTSTALFREPLLLTVASDHRLASRESVRREESRRR